MDNATVHADRKGFLNTLQAGAKQLESSQRLEARLAQNEKEAAAQPEKAPKKAKPQVPKPKPMGGGRTR